MQRSNILLGVLLVVQLVLVGLAWRPATTGDRSGTVTLMPTLDPAKVDRLVIADDNKELTLVRDGNHWRIQGDPALPADDKKVADLIAKLSGLASGQLVARTPESRIRLKVADDLYNRKVTVTVGGEDHVLYLGSSPSYKRLHVRAGGDDRVVVVKDLSVWEVQPGKESWWQNRYLDVARDAVTALTLENEHGTFTLRRGENGFQLDGDDRPLAQAAVDDLLDAATSITLLKYLGTQEEETYGLAKPAGVLTLTTKDQAPLRLRIGPKDEKDNHHVVKRDDSPFFVTVAAYEVEDLLKKKADDLLAPAPATEAATNPPPAQPAAGTTDGAPAGGEEHEDQGHKE